MDSSKNIEIKEITLGPIQIADANGNIIDKSPQEIRDSLIKKDPKNEIVFLLYDIIRQVNKSREQLDDATCFRLIEKILNK